MKFTISQDTILILFFLIWGIKYEFGIPSVGDLLNTVLILGALGIFLFVILPFGLALFQNHEEKN